MAKPSPNPTEKSFFISGTKRVRPDVLFIHPNTNPAVYGELANTMSAIEPPFMAAMIAGSVRSRAFGVEFIDANATGMSHEQVAEAVKHLRPALIVIIVHGQQPSASSQMMGEVGNLCRTIKQSCDVKILLAGTHPSALPERTLREESVDYVAIGEGADTIICLMMAMIDSPAKVELVPNLCWLDGGKFRINHSNWSLQNTLDERYSDVAWDMLPMNCYRAHNWHANFADVRGRRGYASLYTSLGCPFQCSFCCINAPYKAQAVINDANDSEDLASLTDSAKPKMRLFSPEWVIKQIDILVNQYGVRHIKFIDEMYCLNKPHVEAISKLIIERGYNLNMWSYARVDTVNDSALLALMKRSGMNWLGIGIESADKNVRAGADKKFSNEHIFDSVARVEMAGIHIGANYMVGLRNDTQETMRQTLSLAKELNTAWMNIYATMAYPGAPDYAWAKERGIPLPGDPDVPGGWTAYSHHSFYTLPMATEHLSAADVLRFRDNAFNDYFSSPDYQGRACASFGETALVHIQDMLKVKLKRRILDESC